MPEREPPRTNPEHAPYWSEDISLFAGRFRLTHNEPTPIRARVHRSDEPFHRHHGAEIVPLSVPDGIRTYLHLEPYLALPDLRAIVGLAPTHGTDDRVGSLAGAGFAPERIHPIGDAQAWYYPTDQTLVLWECFLAARYRDVPLTEDVNMRLLWGGMEDYLTRRFPAATRLVTPADDLEWDTGEYQEFLQGLGYDQVTPAAFGKTIPKEASHIP